MSRRSNHDRQESQAAPVGGVIKQQGVEVNIGSTTELSDTTFEWQAMAREQELDVLIGEELAPQGNPSVEKRTEEEEQTVTNAASLLRSAGHHKGCPVRTAGAQRED